MQNNDSKNRNCSAYKKSKTLIVTSTPETISNASQLDKILLNPFWGTVVLIATLALILFFMGKVVAIDITHIIFDSFFMEYLSPLISLALQKYLSPDSIFYELLVGQFGIFNMGIGYLFGIIIPIVACFYFFMTILEESGYISRMALLSDNGLKKMGLSGRMTIPIILGFGCITMAFVSISSLKSQKERVIASTLIALTVPCSAQFGIIMGQLAHLGLRYLFVYFAVLFVVFVITGVILNKIIRDDSRKDFIHLDPLKSPSMKNVISITLDKALEFIKEAFPVFVLAAICLTVLSRIGWLNILYDFMAPLTVGLLRLPPEASTAFVLSIIRREFGVVTLLALNLDAYSMLVALITMTLLVPCMSAIFVLYKERGAKEATLICVFCTVMAFAVGGFMAYLLI